MRNFQQKRGWRNIFQSKPVLALFGILILVFAYNILGLWNKMQDTEKNKKIAEDKVAELLQQKKKLTTDINSLNTTEGKEKLFRENFGLAKDGEDLIVVVDDKNSPAVPKPASSGFFGFLKNLFK
ncbi:septum formation initiator family protein [Candidatus Nomurabacteria bacterium]|nr:septum formation initiator family protein [Candidatus Nomurabacteria bacterium]